MYCIPPKESNIDWNALEVSEIDAMRPSTGAKHDWAVEDYDEYRRALARESQRRRRAAAKKAGMCTMCCTRPAREGMKTCRECSARSAEINMRKYVPKKLRK